MPRKPREIIGKTDRSVKTSDAWLGLGEKAVSYVGKLFDPKFWAEAAIVFTATSTVIGNFFGWLTGHGWAGWGMAALAGLFAAMVFAILRNLYRWSRALPAKGSDPATDEGEAAERASTEALAEYFAPVEDRLGKITSGLNGVIRRTEARRCARGNSKVVGRPPRAADDTGRRLASPV
jgi:hypothetical protein